MTTYQFVIAFIAGLPALLVSIGALYHSLRVANLMQRQLVRRHYDDHPYDGRY